MAEITTLPAPSPALQDSKTYEGLFFLSFVLVLLIALVAQTLFLKWRPWFPGAERARNR